MQQFEIGLNQTADDKKLRKDILETLDAEIEVQRNRQEFGEKTYAIETTSDFQEPARPALDTLLRHRAANIREFKDLLDCFERIRRLRSDAA